jgi:hypothetical protein
MGKMRKQTRGGQGFYSKSTRAGTRIQNSEAVDLEVPRRAFGWGIQQRNDPN